MHVTMCMYVFLYSSSNYYYHDYDYYYDYYYEYYICYY